ncbi:MAG: glycosyltransferase family 39 protein [Sedimentisphaerales bacterium]|nr:glycosyltransferase family 39 protein [Sedimentisphaerales bacterium]
MNGTLAEGLLFIGFGGLYVVWMVYLHTARVEAFCQVERAHIVLAIAAISTLLVAGAPFALGKYFEFGTPEPYDGGSYLYSAKHVLSGARIGYEEIPSASAGTLLVNMLAVKLFGFRDIGPKVLQMVFQLGAFVFMFVTLRRLFGTLAAGVGVIVASVYLSAPLIAKYGNVKEQFMIALMISGICSFVYYQLTGKWWWAVLTGMFLIWGPLFKQTGLSAIAAVGLFVLAQPVLHRVSWKQTGKSIVLMVAGAASMLAPLYVWYASMGTPVISWPYSFLYGPLISSSAPAQTQQAQPQAPEVQTDAATDEKPQSSLLLKLLPGYIRDSWEALGPAARRDALLRVLRYYRLLILPILLAVGALVARLVVLLRHRGAKGKDSASDDPGWVVRLFAVWWLVDMAFVWISPRSYEQYYLPLNASAAMLGGYPLYLYARRWHADRDKTRWIIVGLLGLVLMLGLSWHIFFGIARSPHSNVVYRDRRTGQPAPDRGYLQRWREVSSDPAYAWQQVGEYIREHSEPDDTIYVWGWVPGIYVEAQRMSPAPKAFEGNMHTLPPEELAGRVRQLLDAFEKDPPKFIVDTLKVHFPWDRPQLELWPRLQQRFLPPDPQSVREYEAAWSKLLRDRFGPDEAARFEAMKPFRDYVRQNYRIVIELVNQIGGQHIVFVRK